MRSAALISVPAWALWRSLLPIVDDDPREPSTARARDDDDPAGLHVRYLGLEFAAVVVLKEEGLEIEEECDAGTLPSRAIGYHARGLYALNQAKINVHDVIQPGAHYPPLVPVSPSRALPY